MSDLDTQIRTAVVELLDASPPPPPFPGVAPTFAARPPRRSRRVALVALSLAIVLIVTGVAVVATRSDDDTRVTTSPLPRATVLQCRTVVGSEGSLGNGRSAVLGRAGLGTGRTLETSPSGESDPSAAFFAKDGLLVRRSSPFELIVPARWRNRFSISWGDAPRTTRLRVAACPASTPGKEWLAFAGGYFVKKPACVPLIVKTATATQRVHIGVGAPCPSVRRPAGA
jgi:hypothetical protein